LKKRADALTQAVNSSDVVCFVKPGGLCPFCNLATKALLEASAAMGEAAFSLHIADLLSDDREALRAVLDVPVGPSPPISPVPPLYRPI
jgi:glutaredoxin-related protein